MHRSPDLVLEHLRGIRAAVETLRTDMVEVKHRLGAVEVGIANLHQDAAHLRSVVAEQSTRIDRMSNRVERIERRLELAG